MKEKTNAVAESARDGKATVPLLGEERDRWVL
jgi:hypothetical protein